MSQVVAENVAAIDGGRIAVDTHDMPVASQFAARARDSPRTMVSSTFVSTSSDSLVRNSTPDLLMLIVFPSSHAASPARRHRIGSVRGNLKARMDVFAFRKH
jgi:hypothetical protein